MTSIYKRPTDMAERRVPGHWEGDLIKRGGNRSAVAPWWSEPITMSSWPEWMVPMPTLPGRVYPQVPAYSCRCAEESDLRSRQGNGAARGLSPADAHSGVLRRSKQPWSAVEQRKRFDPAVSAQGHGSSKSVPEELNALSDA
jgi:hypothetical protein